MNRILRTEAGREMAGGSLPWKSILSLVVLLAVGLAGAVAAQEDSAVAPVVDVVFGTDLDRQNRVLIGQAEVFTPDVEQIYCLTRIRGLEAPTTVTHAWYHEGQSMARVELKVGSSDWRTWSSKRILPAWTGNWELKVLDDSGKVLATFGFAVN